MRKPFTAQDFSVWHETSTKLRDILSMQLDCLTAESAPSFSVVYVVPNAVSLCPALTFLFLSTFYSSAFCSASPFWDPSCVLAPPNPLPPQRVCASSFAVLSPPFSFLLSRLLMGSGVLGMLLAGVMHYRSRGYENMFPGRRVHKATMHRKHLPPKLWRPKDQPAALAQRIKFPLKIKKNKVG